MIWDAIYFGIFLTLFGTGGDIFIPLLDQILSKKFQTFLEVKISCTAHHTFSRKTSSEFQKSIATNLNKSWYEKHNIERNNRNDEDRQILGCRAVGRNENPGVPVILWWA